MAHRTFDWLSSSNLTDFPQLRDPRDDHPVRETTLVAKLVTHNAVDDGVRGALTIATHSYANT